MVEYTKSQARIAKALVAGPKPMDSLRKELKIPANELSSELAALMKLKLITQSGFPTQYALTDKVRQVVMEESKVARPFKAHIIIEGMGLDRKSLENAQKSMIERMGKDSMLRVQNVEEQDIVEENNTVSSFFEADISCKSFEDLVYMVLTYGPSSIELQKPHEFTIKSEEAQGALMDMANVIHSYAGIIAQLKMKLDRETLNII